MTITYLKGDATAPTADGKKIIVHVCNDIGKWGRGFVLALSKRWAEPERAFKEAFKEDIKPKLGDVQFVPVSDEIIVANVIGQHGVRSPRNKSQPAPIRYEAVSSGLKKVSEYAGETNASVHMPRIGCGLAGGNWAEIEPIVLAELSQANGIFVYDF